MDLVHDTDVGDRRAWKVLTIAAALCFIGHGAFGLIGKGDWLPFFGVAGIGGELAWRLMPWVGLLDIALGIAAYVAPRRALFCYMAGWALWTAALRPLSGLPVWELVERAGNYGVPLALLVWSAAPGLPARPFARLRYPPLASRRHRVRRVLAWTTGLLLIGHGALAIEQKPVLLRHAALLGLGPSAVQLQGWLELMVGLMCIAWPVTALLVLVFVWKLATEMLFLAAGAPIWELVERGGSYGAPLALALLRGGAGFPANMSPRRSFIPSESVVPPAP